MSLYTTSEKLNESHKSDNKTNNKEKVTRNSKMYIPDNEYQ